MASTIGLSYLLKVDTHESSRGGFRYFCEQYTILYSKIGTIYVNTSPYAYRQCNHYNEQSSSLWHIQLGARPSGRPRLEEGILLLHDLGLDGVVALGHGAHQLRVRQRDALQRRLEHLGRVLGLGQLLNVVPGPGLVLVRERLGAPRRARRARAYPVVGAPVHHALALGVLLAALAARWLAGPAVAPGQVVLGSGGDVLSLVFANIPLALRLLGLLAGAQAREHVQGIVCRVGKPLVIVGIKVLALVPALAGAAFAVPVAVTVVLEAIAVAVVLESVFIVRVEVLTLVSTTSVVCARHLAKLSRSRKLSES